MDFNLNCQTKAKKKSGISRCSLIHYWKEEKSLKRQRQRKIYFIALQKCFAIWIRADLWEEFQFNLTTESMRDTTNINFNIHTKKKPHIECMKPIIQILSSLHVRMCNFPFLFPLLVLLIIATCYSNMQIRIMYIAS